MGSIMSGGQQMAQQLIPQPASPAAAPAAPVYQSDDPYAANYKPPGGSVPSPAARAAAAAKEKANASPLAAVEPAETDDERTARLRRSVLVLGSGYGNEMLGGDGGSSGAAV